MNPEPPPLAISPTITLLIIDDDEPLLEMLGRCLNQPGLQIFSASDPEDGMRLFRDLRPEVVLLDLVFPTADGMELLQACNRLDPASEIILMSGNYSTEYAVEAIQKGASDYLAKPVPINRLRARMEVLLEEKRQRRLIGDLDRALIDAFQMEGIVGRSPAIIQLFKMLRRVAPHFKTALITGPSGTGKELVSRALHRLSPAKDKILAVANCSAFSETLIESELFGYVRGAFTGASQDKLGLFEYANHGTVFLDEIGDLPLAGQAKLLRVLQNGEVQRVGSPAQRKVDVNVIAATNRDLRAMVSQGTFREDLYYRLSMTEIALPSLLERKEDLPLLERYFVQRFSAQYHKPVAGLTLRAQAVLARYDWPGNIRELENLIGNACMMVESNIIDVRDLPDHIVHRADSAGTMRSSDEPLMSLEEVQMRHIMRVLQQVGGDKSRAASVLGIGRSTLYSLLGKLQSNKA
ncbi:MAG TPA: sigma-54 dependent transcriptional regulator [Candidatus Koribacter sp.]|jgi:DNA-binding NtrC family response regulator